MARVFADYDEAASKPASQHVTNKAAIAMEGLVALQAQQAAARRKMTPVVYRICWCLIAGYHLANAIFIFLLGAVHVFISQPAVYANIWLIRIDQVLLFLGGWSLLVVAVAHFIALGQNIIQSISQRHLSFGRDDMAGAVKAPSGLTWRTSLVKHLWVPVEWVLRLIGERGLFGVHGDYFYVGFYIRQVAEIAMQTYQAYQFSVSISSHWINFFAIAVVVTNCTFVPLVNYFLRHQPGGRRPTLLTIDLLLDFVLLVLVPMISVIPHALKFNWAAGRYDATYTYDDVWTTTVIAEVRLALISSGLDYVSTVFPHVAGLLTLDTIKGLVQRAAANDRHKATHFDSTLTTAVGASTARPTRLVRVATIVFYVFSFAWLIFTLASHGESQLSYPRDKAGPCLLRGNAWFATRETCFVVEVNCHRSRIQGTEVEIAAVLDTLEAATVSRMIISHCPSLQIPRSIRGFNTMVSLEIFNSTLVDWPEDAAVTKTATPNLYQLHFLATNFTRFPNALLRSDLPPHLGMLIFQSNISELPADVGVVWQSHKWQYFEITRSKLRTLPTSFKHVRSASISLLHNDLHSLEEDVFASSTILTSLRLSGSNITTLPNVNGSTSVLYQIVAEDTKISALPAWFETWRESRRNAGKPLSVSFHGSALCEDAVYSDICASLPPAESGDFRFDLISKQRRL